jgi:hypothetical protein
MIICIIAGTIAISGSVIAFGQNGIEATGMNGPSILRTWFGEIRIGIQDCSEPDCPVFQRLQSPVPHIQFWSFQGVENSGVLAIDTIHGEMIHVFGIPDFEPKNKLFITLNSEENNSTPEQNGTFVWRVTEEGFIQRVAHFDLSKLADHKLDGWISSKCANLSGVNWSGGNTARRMVSVREQSHGWTLSSQPCGG